MLPVEQVSCTDVEGVSAESGTEGSPASDPHLKDASCLDMTQCPEVVILG